MLIKCEQGSDAWHQARSGLITASNFWLCRERKKTGAGKGDFTESAKKYLFRVAVESLTGKPLDGGFETWQMRRGRDLEPDAMARHEMESGVFVEKAGFVVSDCGRYGASADGFVGADEGCEYKCFVSPESLMPILLDDDLSSVMDQIQGGMWITGRSKWHFGLYFPDLEVIGKDLYWRVIERDDEYIKELMADLEYAWLQVEYYKACLLDGYKPQQVEQIVLPKPAFPCLAAETAKTSVSIDDIL